MQGSGWCGWGGRGGGIWGLEGKAEMCCEEVSLVVVMNVLGRVRLVGLLADTHLLMCRSTFYVILSAHSFPIPHHTYTTLYALQYI